MLEPGTLSADERLLSAATTALASASTDPDTLLAVLRDVQVRRLEACLRHLRTLSGVHLTIWTLRGALGVNPGRFCDTPYV